MKKNTLLLFTFLFLQSIGTIAQRGQPATSTKPYSIIIKGGHVIDPKNNINEVMDIAIAGGRPAQPARAAIPARAAQPAQGNQPAVTARAAQPASEASPALPGKIALVSKDINPNLGDKIINASGMYVTPGLLDIHVHTFIGTNGSAYMDGPSALPPDGFTFRSGVTTVVDAGSPGWRSFPDFKKNIIDRSQTRVLTFLNIVGQGMGGGNIENNINDMDPIKAAEFAKANRQYVVGFKVAHFSGIQWIPVDSAVKAGNIANMPVMIDFGGPPENTLEQLFATHLRPGDMQTHLFHKGSESPVDDNGKVKPYVFAAQKKGIFFDIGHGGNGFSFKLAIPSFKQGFFPNSISTDLHIGSMNAGMKDMANIMSKFLNIGMSLKDVVQLSTWNPAKQIKREELGNLSVGSEADIAVFTLRRGNFGFIDSHGFKLNGTQRLEPELTIRSGRVVWDMNGISMPSWETAPQIVNGN